MLTYIPIYGIIINTLHLRRYKPMYNLDTLKRKISKEGLEATIELLRSEYFPEEIKRMLSVFDSKGNLDIEAVRALA